MYRQQRKHPKTNTKSRRWSFQNGLKIQLIDGRHWLEANPVAYNRFWGIVGEQWTEQGEAFDLRISLASDALAQF